MPTYEVVTDFDKEQALREVIEALRADNGKLLRALLKSSNPEFRTLGRALISRDWYAAVGQRPLRPQKRTFVRALGMSAEPEADILRRRSALEKPKWL